MFNRILLFCLAAGLCSCATQPTHLASAKPGAAVAALYTRLDNDSQQIADARTQASPDATEAGAEAGAPDKAAAIADLRAAADACAALQGCQTQRFIAAYARLLQVQASPQPPDSDNADAPDAGAAPEAGESSPVIAALPQAGRSVALLNGHKLGDIIAMNDPLKVAIEQWLTQYRPNLMRAYQNYSYLRHEMWPEYKKAGLPEALLFGILAQESGGKVHAVSRSGASGPLQFMSATGARFGLGVVDGFDQRFDPKQSARANAAYLNEQLGVLNDNLEMALAAYNGGEGAMRRLAATYPSAGFWDPKIYFSVSAETRHYVPMVLAAAWLFLHPERYHLQFPQLADEAAGVDLTTPASLDELTICLGQDGNINGWFRTLRNLNPAYDPRQRLDTGTHVNMPAELVDDYAKYCEQGQWMSLAQDLHSAALPPAPPSRLYVVRKGDTLGAIARKHHCGSVRALARRNRIKPPHYLLHIGQHLHVSQCRR